ncbi:MAG: PAS domain S-box protein, partial [Candidatus Thermoplasmatota archaeon]|nr:PAS domain S-box protein [Candidatus Thermoplasmatota archaeon]
CIISSEMDIVDATRSFLKLFGYARGEVIGEKLNLLFPRDSYDVVEKILHKSNESLEWFAELSLEKKNGEVFTESMGVFAVSDSKKTVHDSRKELVYCMAIQSELRERNGINQFVEASEKRYQELVDRLNEIIFTLDTDGRFTTMNSYSVEPVRYRPDEGMVQELTLGIKAEEIRKGVELPGKTEVPAEFRVMHRAGGEDSVRTLVTVGLNRDYLYKLPEMSLNAISEGSISSDTGDQGPERLEEEKTEENPTNSLISLIRESIIAMDESGRLTDFNDAFLNMTGYSYDEANRIPFSDYFAPDSREFLDSIFEDILRDKTLVDYETSFIRKNGEIYPVSFDATLMEDENGEIKGIIAIVRDMTEDEENEVKLLSGGLLISEYHFVKTLLSTIRDGAIATDEFGQIIFLNESMLLMLDCRVEELVNRLVFDLFSDAKRKGAVEIFEELDNGEKTRFFNSVFQRLDGTPLPVEINACSVMDRYDAKIGYLLVVSKAADEKSKRKEETDEKSTGGIEQKQHEHRPPRTDFLFEMDAKGTIIDVNHQGLKLLNHSGRGLERNKIGDHILIGGSRLESDMLEGLSRMKNGTRTVEGTLLFKDLDPIPLLLTFHAVKVPLGEEVKYQMVIESIPGNVTTGDRDFS